MSNELQPFVDYITQAGAERARMLNPFTKFIGNKDARLQNGQRGSTVMVEYFEEMADAREVVVGTPPANGIVKRFWPVDVNQWYDQGFQLSDREAAESMDKGEMPKAAERALDTVIRKVNRYAMLKCYKRLFGYGGAVNAVPDAIDDIIDMESLFNTDVHNVPDDGQRMLLVNGVVKANWEKLAIFHQANTAGNDSTQVTGKLGRKFSFQIEHSPALSGLSHTAGTVADGKVEGAVAKGATTAVIKSALGGTLKIGDIFSVAGDTQEHSVIGKPSVKTTEPDKGKLEWSDVTVDADGETVEFYPPVQLDAGWADEAAVTVLGSHGINLAFHPDAFIMASRVLENPPNGLGVVAGQEAVPEIGLILRLQVYRDYMRTGWAWDVLFGCDCHNPRFGGRLIQTP